MPGKDKNRGSKRFMDAIKQGQEFSASMKAGKAAMFGKTGPTTGPSATPRNKEIPEGPKGEGLKALPPGVVEKMGYKPISRLNRNMEMETMQPMNAPAMGALTRPMEQLPLSRMYNNALPRASKLSKAKFPLMPIKYMNPPKMGTIFSKANKSKKK